MAVNPHPEKFPLTSTFHARNSSAPDAVNFSQPDKIEVEAIEPKGPPVRGPFPFEPTPSRTTGAATQANRWATHSPENRVESMNSQVSQPEKLLQSMN
jgi:hypothetical protein